MLMNVKLLVKKMTYVKDLYVDPYFECLLNYEDNSNMSGFMRFPGKRFIGSTERVSSGSKS